MHDDSSVILFASNIPVSSPRLQRFKQFVEESIYRFKRSDLRGTLRPLVAYSNAEIFQLLVQYGLQITVLHFEGHHQHYEELLKAARNSIIGDLPTYLGSLRNLRLVFLSGGARPDLVRQLRDKGVPFVIGTTHNLSAESIEMFANIIYERLNKGESLQEAFDVGKQALGITTRRPIPSIILSGDPNIQRFRLNNPEAKADNLWSRFIGEVPNYQTEKVNNQGSKAILEQRLPEGAIAYYVHLEILNERSEPLSFVSGKAEVLVDRRYRLQCLIEESKESLAWVQNGKKNSQQEFLITTFGTNIDIYGEWIKSYSLQQNTKGRYLDFIFRPMKLGESTVYIDIFYQLHWLNRFEVSLLTIEKSS